MELQQLFLTTKDIVKIFKEHGGVNDVAELFYERAEKSLPKEEVENIRNDLDKGWDK